MCSLLEPYATLAVAGEMQSAGGALLSAGPTADTILASVSSSSVALMKVDDSKAVRYWFSKPSTPFTTTAVWDPVENKVVSASQGKVLAWTNSEKAVVSTVAECPSSVLSLLPSSRGVIVVCKNGLAFQLQYDKPNWSIQSTLSVKGVFSWACSINDNVFLLAEDGKSFSCFRLDDPSSRTIIKTPNKFTISVCCHHGDKIYVGNSQGKILVLQEKSLESSKIDLKMEQNQLTGLVSCGGDLLIASQTMLSLWDVQFGLVRATTKIAFTPWTNKSFLIGNKAFFAHTSIMAVPLKLPKWSLAGLVGSRKKSEKKTPGCLDACESLLSDVAGWTATDIQKHVHEIDDLSEAFIVKCWQRLLDINGDSHLFYKLIAARHDCQKLTPVLHESLKLDAVQNSISLVATAIAEVTLTQLAQGRLESLMDWACHLIDAHRNALRVSLKSSNSDSTQSCLEKLDRSIQKIQKLTEQLQDGQQELKVFLNRTGEIQVPREKLYWTEPWEFLNKT